MEYFLLILDYNKDLLSQPVTVQSITCIFRILCLSCGGIVLSSPCPPKVGQLMGTPWGWGSQGLAGL